MVIKSEKLSPATVNPKNRTISKISKIKPIYSSRMEIFSSAKPTTIYPTAEGRKFLQSGTTILGSIKWVKNGVLGNTSKKTSLLTLEISEMIFFTDLELSYIPIIGEKRVFGSLGNFRKVKNN